MAMKTMSYKNLTAMTLIEMIVAISIMATIFAIFAPQLRLIQNSWASKQAQTETLQNGRVFIEDITDSLQQARQVTAVSGASDTNGYIEFIAQDNVTRRYQLSSSNIVFGEPNSLAILAGPAVSLSFSCFSATDSVTPTTDPNLIRSVKITAAFKDPAASTTETYTGHAYLRTNANLAQASYGSKLNFNIYPARSPSLAAIDSTHYLCAYSTSYNTGQAQIFFVDTVGKSVYSVDAAYFDWSLALTPALAKIDNSHYLVVYEGAYSNGHANVLQVNTYIYALWTGNSFVFDSSICEHPSVTQIDSTRFLCAYRGAYGYGYAVVLTANTTYDTVSKSATFRFDSNRCYNPDIVKIDSTRYFVTYRGEADDGYAAVLSVNLATNEITKTSSFEFDAEHCDNPSLAKYDDSYYVCGYTGKDDDGFITLLNVNSDSGISKIASLEYDKKNGKVPCVKKINTRDFVCSYQAESNRGIACVFSVKPAAAAITIKGSVLFETADNAKSDLIQVDAGNFLCAYQGPTDKGYAFILDTAVQIIP